jgi:hypothetical protein
MSVEAGGAGLHPELRAALLAALDERAPRVDRDRVAACFDFAARAHGEQRRESGEPYISHAIAVSLILLDLLDVRIDTPIVCAALLHDVVEDTGDDRGRREAIRQGGRRPGRGRHQAVASPLRATRGRTGRELPQDAAVDVARPARHLHQARRSLHNMRTIGSCGRQVHASRSRRGTSTRRSRTGSAWRASSASSRT